MRPKVGVAALVALALAASPLVVPARAADPLDATVAHDLEFAGAQLARTQAEIPAGQYPVATTTGGVWGTSSASAWTSGFFPGALWLMYEATGDPSWRAAAESRQAGVESQKTNTSTHDIGFIIFDSFGNGYRLTGDDSFRHVVLQAAASLSTRFNPTVGAIRSWNNPSGAPADDFRVIVDNMMNLQLLLWAAQHGGDPTWTSMAVSHALRSRQDHVRPDGSTYQLVIYDSDDGTVKSKQTVQGYSVDTTWSRGQAWALYGFGTVYAMTGDQRFLDTARQTADYFVTHLPPDHVPYWDFQAPGIPNEPRDSSAAAVAASGLLQLSQLDPDPTRARGYLDDAKAILTSLSSTAYIAEGTANHALLLHGTQNKPAGQYDSGLIWGDYFFLEALVRYRAIAAAQAGGPPPAAPAPGLQAPPGGLPLKLAIALRGHRPRVASVLRRGLPLRLEANAPGIVHWRVTLGRRSLAHGLQRLATAGAHNLRIRFGSAARRRLRRVPRPLLRVKGTLTGTLGATAHAAYRVRLRR